MLHLSTRRFCSDSRDQLTLASRPTVRLRGEALSPREIPIRSQLPQPRPLAFFFRSPRRLAAHCPGPVSWPTLSRYRCSLSDLRRPLDRFAQPLHGELDILGLQFAPALDFGLVAVLREALEIFGGQFPGVCPIPSELRADEWVLGHLVPRIVTPKHSTEAYLALPYHN